MLGRRPVETKPTFLGRFVLSDLFIIEGMPDFIRSDNGGEFTAQSLQPSPPALIASLQAASAARNRQQSAVLRSG